MQRRPADVPDPFPPRHHHDYILLYSKMIIINIRKPAREVVGSFAPADKLPDRVGMRHRVHRARRQRPVTAASLVLRQV